MKVATDTTTVISQGFEPGYSEPPAAVSPAFPGPEAGAGPSWSLPPALKGQRTVTLGTTDMPGPISTSGRSSKVIFTGTRWTTLT